MDDIYSFFLSSYSSASTSSLSSSSSSLSSSSYRRELAKAKPPFPLLAIVACSWLDRSINC